MFSVKVVQLDGKQVQPRWLLLRSFERERKASRARSRNAHAQVDACGDHPYNQDSVVSSHFQFVVNGGVNFVIISLLNGIEKSTSKSISFD